MRLRTQMVTTLYVNRHIAELQRQIIELETICRSKKTIICEDLIKETTTYVAALNSPGCIILNKVSLKYRLEIAKKIEKQINKPTRLI